MEPLLSKITNQDRFLLQHMVAKFRHDSLNYEDSWGYIIQATRFEGFRWWDAATETLVFFTRKITNPEILVIPTFFAKPEELKQILRGGYIFIH